MAKGARKDILWEVGCEGHRDAWVVAESWELATVEAAKFWDVPWKEVASRCEMKQKITGAPRNICCKCGKTYFGRPPMCTACEKNERFEEAEMQRRLRRAYRLGKVI